jgi:YD repeat-containing protein
MASIAQGTRNSNFFYDGATGYLESRENALGERVSYTRDALGRVETLSLPDASMWAYSWDSMGNLTTLTEPGGAIAHRFTYSPVNLMERYTSPMGAVESFDYNLEKQLVRRAYPGGGEIRWQYNSKRQLEQSIAPEGSHAFAYHVAGGQLQQALSRDGQTIDYTYGGSLLTGVAWRNIVSGDIAYTYDNDLRVSRFTYGGASAGAQRAKRPSDRRKRWWLRDCLHAHRLR